MLTKQEILARRPAAPKPVEMTAWGGTVYVRQMSAAERDSYEGERLEANKQGTPFQNFRASLVARTACNEKGERLFNDEEVSTLAELPADEIRVVFDAAAEINALSDKEVKELEKNS